MDKIKNTAPLVIGEGLNKQRLSRRFIGGENQPATNSCFERKELNAYLKGHTHFFYKKDENGFPARYEVRQEYFYVPAGK